VDCYVPCFRQRLINCPLSALLFSSLCLLKVCGEISFFLLPPSPVCLQHLHPLLHVPFQFLVYYSVLCVCVSVCVCVCVCVCVWQGVCLSRAMLVFPRGGCGNTAWRSFAHLLVCWMSPKQVWSRCLVAWEPSCFLSVTWCGEALYGLGVQDVKVLILLGSFFSAKCGSSV
jgi:hypothetical protein